MKKPEPLIGTCTECGYLGYIVTGHTARWRVRQICRGCAEAKATATLPARKPPKREVDPGKAKRRKRNGS